MKEKLIEARNLKTWFELKRFGFFHHGYVKAVDGVSFALRRGESAAFVGESGCGKSSLARTLLGLYRPVSGKIVFAGREVDFSDPGSRREFCRRVGYVQQDPYGALPPFMNARRVLAEPLAVNGVKGRSETERRIRASLEEARLFPADEFLGKFPHMLSGGQQQRLVIARALILEPEMIIADEPVSMIDATIRVEILNLLHEIRRKRALSLVFITHDITSVQGSADRIFVMYAGRIVENAPTEQLLENTLHPYTRALIEAIPTPDSRNALKLKKLPGGEPPSLLNPPPGCRFHPRCPLVMPGLCDSRHPPEFEAEPGHYSSCWLMEGKPGGKPHER